MDNTNKAIKFSDDELAQLKSLQSDYQKIILKFGELNIRRMEIENEISSVKQTEESLKQDYINIQKQEEKMVQSLVGKYGEGQLSLSTGEFIPQSK